MKRCWGPQSFLLETLEFPNLAWLKCDHRFALRMKAAILKKLWRAKSLIYYTNTKKPELSNSEQLFDRVTAVALSTLDAEVRSGDWEKIQDNNFDEGVGESSEGAGLKDQPYILGYEFSGVVEAVGSAVTRFQAREEVCGLCSIVNGWSMRGIYCY